MEDFERLPEVGLGWKTISHEEHLVFFGETIISERACGVTEQILAISYDKARCIVSSYP